MDLSQTDEKDNHGQEKTIPSILKYMDRDCERPRLLSLLNLVLLHDSGHNVISDILLLCDRYSLHRLRSVVLDSKNSNNKSESSSPS